LTTGVEKDAVAGDAALTDALARARGLGAISSIADAPAAAKRAADEAGRGRASEALAAGSRALSLFKDPVPGDLDALEAGGKFVADVRDSVGKLPDGCGGQAGCVGEVRERSSSRDVHGERRQDVDGRRGDGAARGGHGVGVRREVG
jgi:hypothetical protein